MANQLTSSEVFELQSLYETLKSIKGIEKLAKYSDQELLDAFKIVDGSPSTSSGTVPTSKPYNCAENKARSKEFGEKVEASTTMKQVAELVAGLTDDQADFEFKKLVKTMTGKTEDVLKKEDFEPEKIPVPAPKNNNKNQKKKKSKSKKNKNKSNEGEKAAKPSEDPLAPDEASKKEEVHTEAPEQAVMPNIHPPRRKGNIFLTTANYTEAVAIISRFREIGRLVKNNLPLPPNITYRNIDHEEFFRKVAQQNPFVAQALRDLGPVPIAEQNIFPQVLPNGERGPFPDALDMRNGIHHNNTLYIPYDMSGPRREILTTLPDGKLLAGVHE